MANLDRFTNQYSLSKTLRFELIPEGATDAYFEERELLKEDEERAKEYDEVKAMIDDCHREYIEERLSGFAFDKTRLESYSVNNREKTDELRKLVSKYLTDGDFYKAYLNGGYTNLIKTYPPQKYADDSEKLAILGDFDGFHVYFKNFHVKRDNM